MLALFPWTVSIQDPEQSNHFCTGFILNLDDEQNSGWVGTSASCIFENGGGNNEAWKNWAVRDLLFILDDILTKF